MHELSRSSRDVVQSGNCRTNQYGSCSKRAVHLCRPGEGGGQILLDPQTRQKIKRDAPFRSIGAGEIF